MREAGYEDLHKNINDLRSLNPSSQLKATIGNAINQSYVPKPPPAGAQPSAPPSFVQTGTETAPAEANTIVASSGDRVALSEKAGDTPAAAEHGAAAEGAQNPVVEPSKDHAAPVA